MRTSKLPRGRSLLHTQIWLKPNFTEDQICARTCLTFSCSVIVLPNHFVRFTIMFMFQNKNINSRHVVWNHYRINVCRCKLFITSVSWWDSNVSQLFWACSFSFVIRHYSCIAGCNALLNIIHKTSQHSSKRLGENVAPLNKLHDCVLFRNILYDKPYPKGVNFRFHHPQSLRIILEQCWVKLRRVLLSLDLGTKFFWSSSIVSITKHENWKENILIIC